MKASGSAEKEAQQLVGERVPCWDAKRRVWDAIDLLRKQRQQQRGREPTPVARQTPSSDRLARVVGG